jgi:hypothetical protein
MTFKIRFQHLVGHRARCRTEIAARPQLLAPIALLQTGIFLLQLARRFAFDILHRLRHRQLRGCRYKQMHMVMTQVPADNLYIMLGTYLANQIPLPQRQVSLQHRITVLCYPHYMVLDVINRMRPFAIHYI